MNSSNDYIGSGWSLPIRFSDNGGSLKCISDVELIETSIKLILSTSQSERIANPEFGCDLDDEVYFANNHAIRRNIIGRVDMALLNYEPRIDVLNVEVELSQSNQGKLNILIDYRIRNTNTRYNMVYPLYINEASLD